MLAVSKKAATRIDKRRQRLASHQHPQVTQNNGVGVAPSPRPAQAPGTPAVVVPHPNDAGLVERSQETFITIQSAGGPPNTEFAVDPKESEHCQFCDHEFSCKSFPHLVTHESCYTFMCYTANAIDPKESEYYQFCDHKFSCKSFPCLVTHESCYAFMCCTAMRTKRNIATEVDEVTGKKKRKKRTPGVCFDSEEYEGIVAMHSKAGRNSCPMPQHPTNKACFDQCKAAVKGVHGEQATRGSNDKSWDLIWTEPCKALQKHVKERKPMMDRLNCAEKISGEFSPCTIVEKFEEIEQTLWNDSKVVRGKRSTLTKLRHRGCALHPKGGVMRCESLHKAETSDFRGLNPPKQDADIHQLCPVINMIPTGKTNHATALYGRCTRHRNVKLCAMGGNAFYLQFRVHCTNEFASFTTEQWKNNKHWFYIKFLIDVQTTDNAEEMCNDSHSKHIKQVPQKLKIACNKLCHLGRNVGHRELELLEEESDYIRMMGQWNPNMRDSHYSAKLPLRPIRKLAGHHNDNKQCCNPRTAVIPSRELLEMAPLGFACKAHDDLVAANGVEEAPTACEVLKFFQECNKVFFQDAAAMMPLEGKDCLGGDNSREDHPLFAEMPAFKSPEFEAFKAEMKVALDDAVDPGEKTLEKVAPVIQQWHKESNGAIKNLDSKFDNRLGNLETSVNQGFKSIGEEMKRDRAHCVQCFGETLVEVGERITPSPVKRRRLSSDVSPVEGTGKSPAIGEARPLTGTFCSPPPAVATTEGTTGNASDAVHTNFRMVAKHQNLRSLHDEWYGRGEYNDPVWNGLEGGDLKFKAAWRKHPSNNQCSRTRRLVKFLDQCADSNGLSVHEACDKHESTFQLMNRSATKMVEHLQAHGEMATQKGRGRAFKKQTNATTTTTTATTAN